MSKKILLVDDDPGVHLIIVHINRSRLSVISAKNGEQALHLALDKRPNLIILDVIMPGIKGSDLCKKIKAYDVLKSIAVVFLTAKDSEEDIQAEMDAGAVAHLTKPINPVLDLLRIIERTSLSGNNHVEDSRKRLREPLYAGRIIFFPGCLGSCLIRSSR